MRSMTVEEFFGTAAKIAKVGSTPARQCKEANFKRSKEKMLERLKSVDGGKHKVSIPMKHLATERFKGLEDVDGFMPAEDLFKDV